MNDVDNATMGKTIMTTTADHGIRPGDVLHFSGDLSLRKLLTRPRVKYAAAVTGTTIEVDERRMTWAEWRKAIWYSIGYRLG